MRNIQAVSLLCITMAATLCDLRSGRIPNGIIAAGLLCGLTYQLFVDRMTGAILFLGGAGLPVLLFALLYYYRMIGAGDVKLLSVIGGFLGPQQVFACMIDSIFFGGICSVILILHRRNMRQRLFCFWEYVNNHVEEKQWKPYLEEAGEDARFCFSVPVLLGLLCRIRGIF